MLNRLRSLTRVLSSRREFEHGMSEELRFHIDQYTQELIASGATAEEAARKACMEFGGMNDVQEECRGARGLQPFDEASRQLRHAVRLLLKTPRFTATALLTLAICLGANLTIFAVVDGILLRPLPFPEPQRLVTIFNTYPKAGVDRDGSSITNYYERRGRIAALESLAMYREDTAIAGDPGATEREYISRVTPEFFDTLHSRLALGRTFTDSETKDQNSRYVILTDSYRNERQVTVGDQIRLDGVAHTVVGILSPEFRFLSSKARLYVPLTSSLDQRGPRQRHSGGNTRHMIARLRPGATIEQAQSQIDAQSAALEAGGPDEKFLAAAGFRAVVASLHGDHVAAVRPTLLWMQAGALILLLIGAVNLTNLLLIRANSRIKELSIRHALGAGRRHLISQVCVETTLLTLTGGWLGLAAASTGIRVLSTLAADRLPLGGAIALDTRLAIIAVVGAVAFGLILAMPIAWFCLRAQRNRSAHSESRGGTSNRAAQRLRHAFVVAQIALAMMLLTSAGLLGLSLERAMAVSPGFRPDHVLTGEVSVPWSKYTTWPVRLAFNERLLSRLSTQPGVSYVGIVDNVPLSGRSGKSSSAIKGRVTRPGESTRGHYDYGVDGDYFKAMGFTLREGRFLNGEDARRNLRNCVVDEDYARYYWPGVSPLGQKLFRGSQVGSDNEAFTVVGVVGAAKQAGMTETTAQGAIYYPYAYRTNGAVYVAIRANLPPESLAATLERAVRDVDPELPVSDIRSMEARISESLVVSRSAATVAGLFSAIAILLTAIGAYGVLSYAVAQRRREIGVRMALGARPGQIRGQFLSLATRLLAAGIVLGTLGAWLASQAMAALLFGVPPVHVPTLITAAALVAAVSLSACLLPSHNAARISPLQALARE